MAIQDQTCTVSLPLQWEYVTAHEVPAVAHSPMKARLRSRVDTNLIEATARKRNGGLPIGESWCKNAGLFGERPLSTVLRARLIQRMRPDISARVIRMV